MRNERAIFANVLDFEHQTRRREHNRALRASARRILLYLGIAVAVVGVAYYVCVGVIV